MAEKIIATVTGYPENPDLRHIPVECVPDRNAPSVATIIETLRKARGALRDDRHGDAVHAQVTAVLDKLEEA